MHRILSALTLATLNLLVLSGCKSRSSPTAAQAEDASAALSTAPTASAVRPLNDGGARFGLAEHGPVDASAPPGASEPPPIPLASDKLEVVALGRTYNSRILWAQAVGKRFWLSGLNVDAFADGDGPLVKGPDILAKLPYKPGVHSMHVVGAWPRLYALRTKNVEGRMESPEPTLFVYHSDDRSGTWTEAKPLGMSWYPHAFVAWGEGAIVMTSAIQFNAGPYLSPGEVATSLSYLAPDGSVSDPGLPIPKDFLAWTAESDGTTVSLLGTVALPTNKPNEFAGTSGVHLVRLTKDGAKRTLIRPTDGEGTLWPELYKAKVRERGGAAVVSPGSHVLTSGWTPSSLSTFAVGADGNPRVRTFNGNEFCSLDHVQPVGDAIYGIRECFGESGERYDLVRLDAGGKTEKVPLPRIVKNAAGGFRVATAKEKGAIECNPTSIAVREPDDVWVWAKCGGNPALWDRGPAVPVLLRRGRPQEPIVIP